MPVTGLYLAHRVSHTAIPYLKAFRQYVMEDAVPVFANLSERANAIAALEFKRIGERHAGEESYGDMSGVAETAQDKGQVFYDTMVAIRQMSLNLFAAGLFHLLEQQLADLCRDGTFETAPPRDTKLVEVSTWYRNNFNLDLSNLSAWPKIEQLRLLANSVKHGEGSSAVNLRATRPDLFQNPDLCELLGCFPAMHSARVLRLPLAGEDLFVTTAVFSEFSGAVHSLFTEIAEHFFAHGDEYYLVGG
jgi:hypothetical protein